jgi:prepilin-type processing-associated H-X9-DG protein
MYLEDNKNLYPTAFYFTQSLGDSELGNCWYVAVRPYLGNVEEVLLCPNAKKPEGIAGKGHPRVAFDASYFSEGLPLFSYGQNDWVLSGWFGEQDVFSSPTEQKLAWKTNMIRQNFKVPVLGDASYPIATDVWFYPAPPRPPAFSGDHGWRDTTARQDQIKRFCLDRHNLAVNWCFMDGSVRKLGLKQLWYTEFHRNWNRKELDVEEYVTWPEWMKNAK